MSLLTVGCAEDKKPSTTGTGGSMSGSGGSGSGGSGSGGTTGSGGSGSGGAVGTGGTPGTGGAVGTGGMVGTDGGTMACATPTAATGLVSDFSGTTPAALLQTGGMDIWRPSPVPPAMPATVVNGEMHAESPGDWASLSAAISPVTGCVNLASKYTGIKFKIRSPSNTQLLFLIATQETKAESNHHRKMIAVTPTATEVTVNFADLIPAPFGMTPLPAGFKAQERAYAIAFGVLEIKEKLDIFLDDVTFF